MVSGTDVRKPVMIICACPSTVEMETGDPGAYWPAGLAYSMIFKSVKDSVSTNKVE